MFLKNIRAERQPYPTELKAIMSIEEARKSRAWLSTWPGINEGNTPYWRLPALAQKLGIGELYVKDESSRSYLGSFKALGAPIALIRLILRRWPEKQFEPKDLFAGRHAAELSKFTIISATDGNHGRALAAAAKSVGCSCVIVLHKNVSIEREEPIAALGAKVLRVDGNYDESVFEAAKFAAQNGWEVVSDTSYEGYEDIPRDVMQGYGVIADELMEQFDVSLDYPPFTHVFLQGGVGGLAAGICSYLHERFGAKRPTIVVVEPTQADCLIQSALSGKAAKATGTTDSLMAGLSCGEASPLAWRFLESTVDFFVTVDDSQVPAAMCVLATGTFGDIPVLVGESGAAGFAYLMSSNVSEPRAWDELGLSGSSKVLVVNTEGNTAPGIYERLVGRSGVDVLAAQRNWLPS